jgi:hypothetical protein
LAAGEKEITTREWHGFVGSMADVIPVLHIGGWETLEHCVDAL